MNDWQYLKSLLEQFRESGSQMEQIDQLREMLNVFHYQVAEHREKIAELIAYGCTEKEAEEINEETERLEKGAVLIQVMLNIPNTPTTLQ